MLDELDHSGPVPASATGVPAPDHYGWIDVADAPVPARATGHWCVLSLDIARGEGERWPLVLFEDALGEQVGGRHHLGRVRGLIGERYRTIAFVPATAVRYRFYSKAGTSTAADRAMRFAPISRAAAAARILLATLPSAPMLLRPLLAGDVRRARTTLVLLTAAMHQPVDYQDWVRSFDRWPPTPPDAALGGPSVSALVFDRDGGHSPALAATRESLALQAVPMRSAVLTGAESAGWREAAAALGGEYVALIQAGEVLPPHASWFVASELQRLGRPELVLADQDRLDPAGARAEPIFRPEPNHLLMLSGTQTRGVWFVRRDVLEAVGPGADPGWAECLRLALWLRRYEQGGAEGRRIPVVLTHRRDDTQRAPPAVLAGLVNDHLARSGMALRASEAFPMIVRAENPALVPVSILIPSRLRSPLVLRCVLSVLRDLQGSGCELVVGVCQPGPLDAEQAAAARQIEALEGGRVVHLEAARFNFSWVCNQLAAMTGCAHILLLNDDVSVIAPGWLDEMTALMGDPQIGIVGARLLYPDRSVQHGGVIMGLSGLCDHAYRHLPAGEAGPQWRAGLVQELSAVTAACLLVRRAAFEAVGGLDESYPSAFNDVDFCLRVREAGYRVVYAPAAELVHHEMHTYGSHYAGERAPFEAEEMARLRRRWAGLVANDPYHNPNLDLAYGREWSLSFPPRRPQTFQL